MRRMYLGGALALVAFAVAQLAARAATRERILSPIRDHRVADGGSVGAWLAAHDPGRWRIDREETGDFRVIWVAVSGSGYVWSESDDPVPLVEAKSPAATRLTPDRVPPSADR